MSLYSWVKGTFCVLGIGVTSEVLYQLYIHFQKKNRKLKDKNRNDTEVLFFPDYEVACLDFFTRIEKCDRNNCPFSHEDNSLSRLFQLILSARSSLDVCVFVITCDDLTNLLITAHKRGVCVRVITDDEQVNVPGSKVWKLRSEGIAVRTDVSSYFMHHKFVVLDSEMLINGSFNWTRQAITGNQENLMITKNVKVVKQYKDEFKKLWIYFDPNRKPESS